MGRPLPLIDFDMQMISGSRPAASKLKKLPVRPQPAWMSSTISRISCSRQIQSAFPLQGFDDDGGGQVDAAAVVFQRALEIVERVDIVAKVAVERHAERAFERAAGAVPLGRVAGQRQRAHRHAVKGVGKADDAVAFCRKPRDLDGAFDGIRPGRSGEQHLMRHAARGENRFMEGFDEIRLRVRCHVEAMHDAIRTNVVEQRLHHPIRIVAVVERTGTGEKIDIFAAFGVPQAISLCLGEHGGEVAYVRSDVGFVLLECLHGVFSLEPSAGRETGFERTDPYEHLRLVRRIGEKVGVERGRYRDGRVVTVSEALEQRH
jgi:hypothetical protein